MADLGVVEESIWALLAPYREELEEATIYGIPSLRWPGSGSHDYFAAVKRSAKKVSLYAIAVDAWPETLEGCSERFPVQAHRQGHLLLLILGRRDCHRARGVLGAALSGLPRAPRRRREVGAAQCAPPRKSGVHGSRARALPRGRGARSRPDRRGRRTSRAGPGGRGRPARSWPGIECSRRRRRRTVSNAAGHVAADARRRCGLSTVDRDGQQPRRRGGRDSRTQRRGRRRRRAPPGRRGRGRGRPPGPALGEPLDESPTAGDGFDTTHVAAVTLHVSKAAAVLVCPISPAAPSEPRWRRCRRERWAAPNPVEALIISRFVVRSHVLFTTEFEPKP